MSLRALSSANKSLKASKIVNKAAADGYNVDAQSSKQQRYVNQVQGLVC